MLIKKSGKKNIKLSSLPPGPAQYLNNNIRTHPVFSNLHALLFLLWNNGFVKLQRNCP